MKVEMGFDDAQYDMQEMILDVDDLKLHYRTRNGAVQAVDGVNFTLRKNHATVVIGESGCGKSSLAKAILRLLPRNIETFSGKVYIDGEDVMLLSDEQFRRNIRWNRVSMVPQAALNSLNPVVRVGEQVAEPLVIHQKMGKRSALGKALRMFERVGVPSDFLTRYPFELSGGMRQRVAIAMALITDPDIVLLDEPTSALDVLTQANIMNLLKEVKRDVGTSYLLITHDIATSSEIADSVAVMYAGQIVEVSDARRFFEKPLHPYADMLMASVPKLGRHEVPIPILGQPPSLLNPPTGCRFRDRCPARFSKCDEEPPIFQVDEERQVKCWLHEEGVAHYVS